MTREEADYYTAREIVAPQAERILTQTSPFELFGDTVTENRFSALLSGAHRETTRALAGHVR